MQAGDALCCPTFRMIRFSRMSRENFNELLSFLAVAQERSFTRAAARRGVTPSALSHTMRLLEERLGVTLLTRTTRRVVPTSAGEYLLSTIQPLFDEIENRLSSLDEFRSVPRGTLRITVTEEALSCFLRPRLADFLKKYPDIRVEVSANLKLVDIVEESFDAGVRLGEMVSHGMMSVPISPAIDFVVVGAPTYFSENPAPKKPDALTAHNCIGVRLPTYGKIYKWLFRQNGKNIKFQPDGQFTCNSVFSTRDACLDGIGLAYIPRVVAEPHITTGALVPVLEKFCPTHVGFHLFYPRHNQHSMPLSLFIEEMKLQ